MMSDGMIARAEWVERVLGLKVSERQDGSNTTTAKAGPSKGQAVQLAKGMILWNQTRVHLGQEVRKLQGAILDRTKQEADAALIQANVGKLEAVLELLDDRLTEHLNALRGTTDPAEKQALAAQARKLVQEYQAEAAANDLLNEIDDNGFVALDIKSRVTTTLAMMMTII